MTVQRDSQCDLELSTNLHKSIYMQVFIGITLSRSR